MLVGVTGTGALVLLAVLACPIGMGLMMLFMGRGMMGGMKKSRREGDAEDPSLAEMKAEQARLAEKIEALEARQPQPRATEPADERERDPVN
jgi:Protein of unknown function (DUF2933)